MQTVLIVIHLLVVVALIITVLLQRSEGGALGAGGGTGGFMTGRGQANALTRATAILATIFFATSLLLTIIAGWNNKPKSILDGTPASQSSTQNPLAPPVNGANPFDNLKKEPAAPAAPAVPVAPAAPEAPKSR